MADMMWAGRFSKQVDETVNAFNSSIAFDGRMYKHDIQGSMAHAEMLGDCGIIPKEDSLEIIEGLKGILDDIENGKLALDPNAEDIHMFVEAELTKRLGDVGKRLHTARSRNDQVAYRNYNAGIYSPPEGAACYFCSSPYGLCLDAH